MAFIPLLFIFSQLKLSGDGFLLVVYMAGHDSGCSFLILAHNALIYIIMLLDKTLILCSILNILKAVTIHLLSQIIDQLNQTVISC